MANRVTDSDRYELKEGPQTVDGVALIAAERQRQIDAEGWTPDHDDEHTDGELVDAAICYAAEGSNEAPIFGVMHIWPWEEGRFKPSGDPIHSLIKAGALIAAEIDRLQRARTVQP